MAFEGGGSRLEDDFGRIASDLSAQIALRTLRNENDVVAGAWTFNQMFTLPSGAVSGYVLSSDANGLAAWAAVSGLTFTDSTFRLVDDGDATKKLAFQVSGVSSATTRTLTVPDASGTIPTLENAATWTGAQTFDATGLTPRAIFKGDLVSGAMPAAQFTVDMAVIGAGAMFNVYDPTASKTVTYQMSLMTDGAIITMPGTSGTLLNTSSSINVTNKTFTTGNTWAGSGNTITSATASTLIKDASTTTKTFNLDLSGATAATKMTLISSQTAGRSLTLPDATDTLVGKATTDVLTNKTISASATNLIKTSTSGPLFQDATTASKQFGMDLSGQTASTKATLTSFITSNRSHNLPDMTGTLALVGDQAAPPLAFGFSKIDLTAQGAAIAATNITVTGGLAGYYVVHYTLEDTTADLTAGTIQFQVNYTDDVGATTQVGAALALTATGRDTGRFEIYTAGANITFQTNLVGIFGAAKYALHARLLYLG